MVIQEYKAIKSHINEKQPKIQAIAFSQNRSWA